MSDATDRNTLPTAHALRARGWRVIPVHSVGPDGKTCSCRNGRKCDSAGKHPIDNAWQNTPPLSAPDLEEIWRRYPHANIGIATGAASGFWVLDIDPDKGGSDSLKALIAEHGAPPETYTVRTGGKGWQFYFAMPEGVDIRNSVDVKGHKGIDIRGSGGQVVVPPSVSGKGPYAVAKDLPIAQAPGWLLDLALKAAPEGPTTYSTDLPDRSDLPPEEQARLDNYAGKAIKANLDRLDELKVGMGPNYSGPPWNHTVFQVSCAVIEIANSPWNVYTMQAAYDDVFQFAPRDDGFGDDTVNKIFESARTTVGEKARPIPDAPSRAPDFMDAPGVRVDPRVLAMDPSTASGANAQPAGQTGAPTGTSDPSRFFDRTDGLRARNLALEVVGLGPLARGRDGFWSYADGVWSADENVVVERCVDLLGNLYRKAHASNAVDVVQRLVPRMEAEPVPQYINFRNGMLDWQTGEVVPHDKALMSTVQLPINWNPDAQCPRFEAFLAESMTQDYIDLMWEIIGYLMYSGNPLQVAIMLVGPGGNGKGRLIAIIEHLLGRANISGESLDAISGNRFSAVNLHGKIANIAGDIDATYQESTARFKSITGDDFIAAERKYGDRFAFKPWAVNLFSANKIPGSADVSRGYLRRWVVVNMPNIPEVENPRLVESILPELEGIAAKAVPCLRALMERGRFDIKGDAARGKEEFAEAIDQVRQWIADATIAAPEHREKRDNLYNAYVAWANRGGHGRLRNTEFYHRLEAIGFPQVKTKGDRCFVGLLPGNLETKQQALTEDTFFEEVDN